MGEESYTSAEIQSVYSRFQADWAGEMDDMNKMKQRKW